jgi:hypothetical protein
MVLLMSFSLLVARERCKERPRRSNSAIRDCSRRLNTCHRKEGRIRRGHASEPSCYERDDKIDPADARSFAIFTPTAIAIRSLFFFRQLFVIARLIALPRQQSA